MTEQPPTAPVTLTTPLLLGVAIAAGVAIVVNVAGTVVLPANAPVEFGITIFIMIELVVVALVCCFGALAAGRQASVSASSAPGIVAASLVAVAFIAYVAAGGPGAILSLLSGERGRYWHLSGPIALAGLAWAPGAIVAAFAVRRGGRPLGRNLAIAALAAAGILVALAVLWAVLYGLALTD